MDKIMTMEEIVDILVVFDVISKQVGACMLEANSGYVVKPLAEVTG